MHLISRFDPRWYFGECVGILPHKIYGKHKLWNCFWDQYFSITLPDNLVVLGCKSAEVNDCHYQCMVNCKKTAQTRVYCQQHTLISGPHSNVSSPTILLISSRFEQAYVLTFSKKHQCLATACVRLVKLDLSLLGGFIVGWKTVWLDRLDLSKPTIT